MEKFRIINIDRWHRKNLFNLYRHYEDPYFNITAEIDATKLYEFSKEKDASFFLSSLYYSTLAAAQTEGFKIRFHNDQVVEFEDLHLGSTILYDDNSFGFCYFDLLDDFDAFVEDADRRIKDLKEVRNLTPKTNRINLIYYSVIPWVSFTSFKHAHSSEQSDGIPKIVFGKLFDRGERKILPVSVEVHHALADGLHVGMYYQKFQQVIDNLILI